MSVRRLSPTANLLRTSRLFSLPPALPKPTAELTATPKSESDTATLAYPTRAAIQTTQASLGRGDWGLKRPLPLKSTTTTSTPTINIDNIDSIDHITDFDSAADHGLTLRKWQDLNMSISLVEREKSKKTASGINLAPPRSAFDSQYDNTVATERSRDGSSKQRWKFKGPWLAGKTEGEFKDYIDKNIKKRKLDFKRFLRERLESQKAANLRRETVERGEDQAGAGSENASISEEDLEAEIRRLRSDEVTMHGYIAEFLDLPRAQWDPREEVSEKGKASSSYNEKGPPTTHPSAGLSYLRTNSYMFNHPGFGPQENNPPVEARVVGPQKEGKFMRNPRALLGVAGVVGMDTRMTFTKGDDEPAVTQFEPDIPGGPKIWVSPRRADINSRGRVNLEIDRAEKNAKDIAQGYYDPEEPELPPAAVAGARERQLPTMTEMKRRSSSPGASQGYGLEDMGGSSNSGRATPFFGVDDNPENLGDLLKSAMSRQQP